MGCSACPLPRQPARLARWSWWVQQEQMSVPWQPQFSWQFSLVTRRKWGLCCPRTASSSPCSLSEPCRTRTPWRHVSPPSPVTKSGTDEEQQTHTVRSLITVLMLFRSSPKRRTAKRSISISVSVHLALRHRLDIRQHSRLSSRPPLL